MTGAPFQLCAYTVMVQTTTALRFLTFENLYSFQGPDVHPIRRHASEVRRDPVVFSTALLCQHMDKLVLSDRRTAIGERKYGGHARNTRGIKFLARDPYLTLEFQLMDVAI
ncbi:hypothetical protein BDR07DRAFT_1411765 [Suillus spraguei]|nr:hypothetical protein BDR07DRAFT_1416725 [Suillus spraguei]KAG2360725.1 hypothetical protein BDR07DRAFT_1411765 [Suillus spraguei]